MNHHPPDDWLVARAAGTLVEARELLVDVHLLACGPCRRAVHLAESLASAKLRSATPAGIDPRGLQNVMTRLDSQTPMPRPNDTGLPRLLYPWSTNPWRFVVPNVWAIDLPHETDGEMPLRLLWMRPNARLPHQHAGDEASVVLRGGWTDEHGHFGPGDCFVCEDRAHHTQAVDPGEPCIALVLNDAPAVLGLPWRWLSRWIRV